MKKENLAYFGGPKAIENENEWLFHWPIVTDEDINAVADVLRAAAMSGTGITKQFESEFSSWIGSKYALGCCNGTASLTAALFACGVGAGDEVICPSLTYWASCASALWFGATVQFADVERESLCLDPDDLEHRIGPKTKAIIVVHYCGYPADMDRINEIASSQGHESRQRLLFAIIRLIFFWKEKRLPVTALEDEVPGLLEWAETNNLSSPVCIS